MRKVYSSLFISLDGVVEAPDQWQFDGFDDDMEAAMAVALAQTDTALLGRVTYNEWAPFWPTSTIEPFAGFINHVQKYVVSTTLAQVEWQNSTLISKNPIQAIAQLKAQPGNAIGVMGSPTLAHSLLNANLLDELVLTIHPVIVGKGKRLFHEGDALKRLKLVDSKTTRTGVLLATYQPFANE